MIHQIGKFSGTIRNSWNCFSLPPSIIPPKKTALHFEDLTVQQWEELMQECIAQHSSTGNAGSKGMEVDVDDLGEVAKHCWELEGSQVVSWEKGKKVKAKQVETLEEEGNYLGTDELVATRSNRSLRSGSQWGLALGPMMEAVEILIT
ncbi:hypothetical protein P691DRAFT_769100 [Macrolepiota fuliginosa MF-IS2]|uniref:Uncharacterized protein n=1 Tax=Macrolepiota fuliginosa MF-IS2 TaxID=1400762 RepID=A0A9P5WWP9_9AGAR|nr:hypothetical protein P691DRAFT_769100 [Macrolepiota fuliginosa MF-IS2]